MKRNAINIEDVKKRLDLMKGKELRVSVNKGRKKIVRYDGEIIDTYPSVFTLKINNDKNLDMMSFSYSDVICGDIRFADFGSQKNL